MRALSLRWHLGLNSSEMVCRGLATGRGAARKEHGGRGV